MVHAKTADGEKIAVEIENGNRAKADTEVEKKTVKSALELELERDDNEGTSVTTDLRTSTEETKAQSST